MQKWIKILNLFTWIYVYINRYSISFALKSIYSGSDTSLCVFQWGMRVQTYLGSQSQALRGLDTPSLKIYMYITISICMFIDPHLHRSSHLGFMYTPFQNAIQQRVNLYAHSCTYISLYFLSAESLKLNYVKITEGWKVANIRVPHKYVSIMYKTMHTYS